MTIRGLLFAKQYPNTLEPLRGTFVARQVAATAAQVDWRVIAPVPWAPAALANVLGRPQPPVRETLAGIEVAHPRYAVAPLRIGYRRAAGAMARASARPFSEAVRGGVDLVHAHGLYPSACAAARLALDRAPLVITLHGSDLYAQLGDAGLVAAMTVAATRAARVVCVSESLARDAAASLGLPREAISVIPDAYDDDRFSFVDRAAHGGPVRLLSVGRLERVKGPDVVIEALGHLVRAGRDAHLTMVGDGSQHASLLRLAGELGIGDRVRFAGALSGDALVSEMSRADLYVQPSRREGFGVALVEAMATGLPVVATRSGGPEGIVSTGDGILVVPDDAPALAAGLAEALDRLDTFDRCAIAGRVRERYSRAAVGAALVDLYRKVVPA